MVVINRKEVPCLQVLLLLVNHLVLSSTAVPSTTIPNDFFYHNFLRRNQSKEGMNNVKKKLLVVSKKFNVKQIFNLDMLYNTTATWGCGCGSGPGIFLCSVCMLFYLLEVCIGSPAFSLFQNMHVRATVNSQLSGGSLMM